MPDRSRSQPRRRGRRVEDRRRRRADAPSAADTVAARAVGGGSFGDMLTSQIGKPHRPPDERRDASQPLATGTATDPTAGRHGRRAGAAGDAARRPDPHQGRRGPSTTSSTPRSRPMPSQPTARASLIAPCSHERAQAHACAGASSSASCARRSPCFLLKIAAAPSYATLIDRARPARRPARSPPRSTTQGDRLRAAEQRHRDRRREGADRARRASRSPAPGLTRPRAQPGFELFDKQKLGATDFQQQVTYQRALEGEIAKTIEQRPGRQRRAGAARAAQDDQLFADDGRRRRRPPSCSSAAETRPRLGARHRQPRRLERSRA